MPHPSLSGPDALDFRVVRASSHVKRPPMLRDDAQGGFDRRPNGWRDGTCSWQTAVRPLTLSGKSVTIKLYRAKVFELPYGS